MKFLTKNQRNQNHEECLKIVVETMKKINATSAQIKKVKSARIIDHARRVANAGTATDDLIEMNLHLNTTMNDYRKTLLHEYAHVMCFAIYPEDKAHHGPNWKSVMVQLGEEPTRCHDKPLYILYPDKWRLVICEDCKTKHEISYYKVRKIIRNEKWYICSCGQQLDILDSDEKLKFLAIR